jgi:hypothetical protein
VSGNTYDCTWNCTSDESYKFEIWSSTDVGSYPPMGMTLRKKTVKKSGRITITGTRPSYWRVVVKDDWDTEEANYASDPKTIS